MVIKKDLRRKKLIAQVHIAKNQLGLDDDIYRDALYLATKKRSCADMSIIELHKAVSHFENLGFNPKKNAKGKRYYSPKSRDQEFKNMADKARALWIDGAKESYIKDGSEQALGKFCYRMTGKYSIDWCSSDETHRVIEAIKQMRERINRDL